MKSASECFSGRIGVIGAGALGAFYGARLARAGAEVHFLARRDYEAIRERGLEVRSIDGDFTLRPPVYRTPEALGVCDLLLIGLKATDNAALPELLGPTCGPRTLVLTLQNGLGNEQAIAAVLARIDAARGGGAAEAPEARVLGGTAFLCSNRVGPGVIAHTDHGAVRLAEMLGPATARTRAIAALFGQAGIDCEADDSLARIRWRKLIWNVPFNGLGVAGRADTAAVLADPALRAAARGLMDEVIAGAAADGVALDAELAARMMHATESMGAYRSSMQIDCECGRPLEVEAILGEPYRRARAAGIAVPRLELLYGLVRRVDEHRVQACPAAALGGPP